MTTKLQKVLQQPTRREIVPTQTTLVAVISNVLYSHQIGGNRKC